MIVEFGLTPYCIPFLHGSLDQGLEIQFHHQLLNQWYRGLLWEWSRYWCIEII